MVFAPASSASAAATFTLSTPLQQTLTLNGTGSSIGSTRVGQSARYTFAGVAGKGYGITLTGSGTSAAPKLSVYQPGGVVLVAPTTISAAGPPLATPVQPITGGNTVVVEPVSATPLSSLTLTALDDTVGSIVYGGAAQSVTVDKPGRATLFSFTLNAASKVNTYLSVSSRPTAVKIFDAFGNVIAPGTNAIPGNYYVLAYPTNLTTSGIASVQLGIADLKLQTVSVTPNPISLLQSTNCTLYGITVNYSVTNLGSLPATPPWTDQFVLSQQVNGDGLLLGWVSPITQTILPGQTVNASSVFNNVYFSQVSPGTTYYVVGFVDVFGAVYDKDPTNQQLSSAVSFYAQSQSPPNCQ